MGFSRGPNIVTDGLVFGYDADERSTRFYKGEPTTNLYIGPSTNGTYFTGAYNGNYGFGASTNIQTVIDNSDAFFSYLDVQKIYRINSGVSQFDYIEWSTFIKRGGDSLFQPNEVRNISFYYKGTFGTILNPYIGSSGTLLLYSDMATAGNGTTNISIPVTTNEWQRISFNVYNASTTNTTLYGYGWMVLHSDQFTAILSNTEYWKFTGIQVERKSHPTQFVNGTRGVTGSLIDLKRTALIDVSNVSFDSTAHPTFDGTDDYIKMPSDIVPVSSIRSNGVSYTALIKPNMLTGQRIVGQQISSSYSDYSSGGLFIDNSKAGIVAYDDNITYVYTTGSTTLEINKWYYIVGTYNPIDKLLRIYVNGMLDGISSQITTFSRLSVNGSNRIGIKDHTIPLPFNGNISIVKIYNKTLTEQEVLQNYNAYKQRFNFLDMATKWGPEIVTDGLVLALDAGNPRSYPGSGTTWYDLSGNRFNHTIIGGPTFSNGEFILNETQGFELNSMPTISTTASVVLFYKTTDLQELYLTGQDGNYYVAASNNNNYYSRNAGTPSYFIDLISVTNPTAYRNGNYHMWEAKNINLSTWTKTRWFRYGGGWSINGTVSTILMYNRSLTASESEQNFKVFKNRFNL